MGPQAAGPGSPSSEGNNLEMHLLGTSEAAELSPARDSPACKAQRKRTDSTGRSPGPPGKETGMKRADFYLCVYQKADFPLPTPIKG
ncbi:hypothetical protein DV515_00007485, partial [Chloebia gouldiae]